MANHFKGILQFDISDNQSDFIPGRLIFDNIMVSYEIMHFLKRKMTGKAGRMAIKFDMSRAYDRVKWNFLTSIMQKSRFDSHWVKLVMECVFSVSYSILTGGQSLGPSVPSRGIRQGDPLSPYLFLLCAEGFSTLLSDFVDKGRLKGIRIVRSPPMASDM